MNNINEKIENMNNLVELHLHLDGALSLDNCKKLAKIQNIDISNDEEILNFITVKEKGSLNEFLDKFEFSLSLLQTPEGIKNAVKNLEDELIEKLYPNTEIWKTCTPYFDKRNIHFYVNKLKFHIVEYLNEKYPDKNRPEDTYLEDDGMFVFEKYMK